jgi:EAL and modified HD-GYP domain-containing signal transduction protein
MADEWLPLLELADVVKLDVRVYTTAALRALVASLRRYPVRLLAEKVETHAEFDLCREMGFHLFQGYFFCEPLIVRGTQASSSRLAILQLLQKLNDPDFSFQELAKLIGTDAVLVYKLLRYINSAFFARSRKVESIQQALVLLGERNVRLWLSLIALVQSAGENRELLLVSLVRARMCELLADRVGGAAEHEKYFLAGLLSSADALLRRPLDEVLASINLADELQAAILRHEGAIGRVLELVVDLERGELEALAPMGFPATAVNDSYLEAIEWARQSLSVIEG